MKWEDVKREKETVKSFEEFDFVDSQQQAMLERISAYYPCIPAGMSDYQIETFVLRSDEHPTWYSVYYQCVLESWVRLRSVFETMVDIQRRRLDIKLLAARSARLQERIKEQADRILEAKDEILQLDLQAERHRITFQMADLQKSFRELEVFERVRKVAEKKMGKVNGKIPEYGDSGCEQIKWYLKFLINGTQMAQSLVVGDQRGSRGLVEAYLNSVKDEDRPFSLVVEQIDELLRLSKSGPSLSTLNRTKDSAK